MRHNVVSQKEETEATFLRYEVGTQYKTYIFEYLLPFVCIEMTMDRTNSFCDRSEHLMMLGVNVIYSFCSMEETVIERLIQKHKKKKT